VRVLLRTLATVGIALVGGSCVPHFFEGHVAVLLPSPAISVSQESSDWGDCYRRFSSVPTVYRIERPAYALILVHGQRYWAEFFLVARNRSGQELGVNGPLVSPVRYRSGGDMRRLSESRGVLPSHETSILDASKSPLVITITDGSGRTLGLETVSFRVESVACSETDSI
jgi:hypothetical protein